jgi:hypothetical protein
MSGLDARTRNESNTNANTMDVRIRPKPSYTYVYVLIGLFISALIIWFFVLDSDGESPDGESPDGVSTWISVPKDNSKQWVSGGVPVSGVDTLDACKNTAIAEGRNFVAWYTKGNYNGSKCLASTRSSVPTSWSTSTRDVAMDHYYLQPEAK